MYKKVMPFLYKKNGFTLLELLVVLAIIGVENDYCYDYDSVNGYAIAYVRLESLVESSKCAVNTLPWFVYSGPEGRAGLVCSAAEPAALANQPWNGVQ